MSMKWIRSAVESATNSLQNSEVSKGPEMSIEKMFSWGFVIVGLFMAVTYVFHLKNQYPADEELQKAAQIGNPYEAYVYLQKAEANWSEKRDDDESPKFDADYLVAKTNFLLDAVHQMDGRSYLELYNFDTSSLFYPDELVPQLKKIEETKVKVAPTVLKTAETSEIPSVLVSAAKLLSTGELTTKDLMLANQYYQRAWAAGHAQSANDTAATYVSIKDYENAYLWSLKCLEGCQRDIEVRLDQLELKLDPAKVLEIQQLVQKGQGVKAS